MSTDAVEGEDGGVRRCYSISNDESFSISSPQLQGRRGWGTRYGWVITLGLDSEMHLSNPLTKQQIHLPSKPTFKLRQYEIFVKPKHMCRALLTKFAFSLDPSNSTHSLVVMAIYGGYCDLAFASPGDKAWTSLMKFQPSTRRDIIFFKDHFYSICNRGTLYICDINTTTGPHEKPIAYFPNLKFSQTFELYLAEISGDLHLICRTLRYISGGDDDDDNDDDDDDIDDEDGDDGDDDDDNCIEDHVETSGFYKYKEDHVETSGFYMYKFDFHASKWIEVKDFNAQALFVGNNTTFAIPTSDYPELKPNCIYFTDDYSDVCKNGFCDMGVYDYERKTFLDPFCNWGDSLSKFSRPFFFLPSQPSSTCP